MKIPEHLIDASTPERPTIRRPDVRPTVEDAVDTGRKGYHVVPLHPGTKRPVIEDWPNKATTDEAQIRRWWKSYPNANIGIVTAPSHLLVIDLDVKHEGDGPRNWYERTRGLDLPEPLVVHTPSGGVQLYYQLDGEPVTGAVDREAGIDLRSDRNLVLAPGSYTIETADQSEGLYWVDGDLDVGEIGTLPPVAELFVADRDVLAVVNARRASERPEHHGAASSGLPLYPEGQRVALTRETITLATMGEGGRHDQLFKSTAALAEIASADGAVITEDDVYTAMHEASRENGYLDDHEDFDRTFKDAWAGGSGQPRTLGADHKVSANGFNARLVDLGAWFLEEHPIPERFGMGGIVYEEGLHWIAGEPESGKSVLAYQWALDAIEAGKRVLIVDEEAGERDALGKLAALEPRTDRWASRLDYLPPSGWDLRTNATRFHQFVLDRGVSMVVIDSASTVLGAAGLDENSNTDVTSFIKTVLIPLAKEHGLCVVVVDHKTKSAVDSRYARGASAKLGLVDFQISVSASPAFSRDQSGALHLTCDKDRFGVHGRGHQWRVDVAVGNGQILPSVIDMSAGAVARNTPGELVMLAQAVTAQAGKPLSKTKIKERMKQHQPASATRLTDAVAEAIYLGLLVNAGKDLWQATPDPVPTPSDPFSEVSPENGSSDD